MTLDAMHWVWTHSQSKGNTRVALLYVADQVRTPAAEVRLGRPDFMGAMNAAKNTVRDAVADAIKLGELEIVQPSAGRRSALYRIPGAVDYVRRGSDPDPLETRRGSTSDPLRTDGPIRSGSESDPLESVEGQDSTRRGSDVDPPSPSQKTQAGEQGPKDDAFTSCQPLIQAMTNAGIVVSWNMKAADWFDIAAIIDRTGVPAMVGYAKDTAATTRQPIRYATFFLRGGWRGLPPKSTAPSKAPRDSSRPPYCGDPDCDPITRTRDVENERGLRFSQPCPKCHPASRKDPAA